MRRGECPGCGLGNSENSMSSIEVLDEGVLRSREIRVKQVSASNISLNGTLANLTLNAGAGKMVRVGVDNSDVMHVSLASLAVPSAVLSVSATLSVASATFDAASVSGTALSAVAGTFAATSAVCGTLQVASGTLSSASVAVSGVLRTPSITQLSSGSLFTDVVAASALSTLRDNVSADSDTLQNLRIFAATLSPVSMASSSATVTAGQVSAKAASATLPGYTLASGTYVYSANSVPLANADNVLVGSVLYSMAQPSSTGTATFTAAATQPSVVVVTEAPSQGVYYAGSLAAGNPNTTVASGVLWLTADGAVYSTTTQPSAPNVSLVSWDLTTYPSTQLRTQVLTFAQSRLASGKAGAVLSAIVVSGGGTSNGAQLMAARSLGSVWVSIWNGPSSYHTNAAVAAWTQ